LPEKAGDVPETSAASQVEPGAEPMLGARKCGLALQRQQQVWPAEPGLQLPSALLGRYWDVAVYMLEELPARLFVPG